MKKGIIVLMALLSVSCSTQMEIDTEEKIHSVDVFQNGDKAKSSSTSETTTSKDASSESSKGTTSSRTGAGDGNTPPPDDDKPGG